MNRDLFGKEIQPTYTQGELGGPMMPVGRTCPDCGRALVKTQSGFNSCPVGHGYLSIPNDYRQLSLGEMFIPVWTRM